ncbi:MAG: hypothetical protein V3S20_07320, partial [Dehalococcoidia bacterium]
GLEVRYAPWWGILGAFLLAELVGWTIRFRYIGPLFDWMTHTVTVLGHAGDRSAVALEQLKSTRERVREGMASDKGDGEPSLDEPGLLPLATTSDSVGLTSPSVKRGAGKPVPQPQADKPAGDLHEALGGAKATEPAEGTTPKPAGGDSQETPEQTTTSRLLRAKRRAKRDQEDEK